MSKRLSFPARVFLLRGGALAAYGAVGGAVADVAALPAASAAGAPLEPRSVQHSPARGAWLLFFRALGAAGDGGAHDRVRVRVYQGVVLAPRPPASPPPPQARSSDGGRALALARAALQR